MKIVVAESAGFCFGVRRAVAICEKAAAAHRSCVMLGPVIHNERVIGDLEKSGIKVVTDISEISPSDAVIIRSHGAGKKEYDALASLGAEIIDATCPDVKRIHDIVREESGEGRLPVVIGERSHPEVAAISGWCLSCEVIETTEELSKWLQDGDNAQKPVSVVFQTTNTKTVYNSSVKIIKKECTNYRIFDTICSATFKRQQEAAELSKHSDVMVVVGGKNSANSLKLADICREHCKRVIFVEGANDIEGADIRLSDTVGVTAGASTPVAIIKEVNQKMCEEVKLDDTLVEKITLDAVQAPESAIAETPDEIAAPVEPAEAEEPAEPEEVEEAEEPAEPEQAEEAEEPADETECAVQEPDLIVEEAPGYNAATVETEAAEENYPGGTEAEEIPLCELQEPEQAEVQADAPDTAEPDAEDEQMDSEDMPSAHESFEEMLEKSIKTLHTGQKVTGTVTSITTTEVSVDLGTKQSGYIPIGEFTDDSNARIEDVVKIGDTIETFVMRVNDVEGMVMLSKRRLDAIKNWDDIEASKESRAIVEGIVTEENKGGLVVNVKGVRVFVPASQTGLPKSASMSELVKKTVKLRITEVNQSRRRVVGSIRAVQAEERREKSDRLWDDIEVGKQYSGVVKSMTSYGVFVDIGGVDGMIHVSELSWTRIKQPSEIMAVGDEVTVHVLSFDKESRKISLSYKKSEDNPWTRFTTKHAAGDIVNVKIVKMMPFGAFAEICPGVDGLIHISQITDHRIGLPNEVLTDGQKVDVKITEIDFDRKKVSLSIRALIDPSSQPVTDKEAIEASVADKTPVIVFDTDAPPPEEPGPADDEQQAVAEPEIAGESAEAGVAPEPASVVKAAEAKEEAEPETAPVTEADVGR